MLHPLLVAQGSILAALADFLAGIQLLLILDPIKAIALDTGSLGSTFGDILHQHFAEELGGIALLVEECNLPGALSNSLQNLDLL